MAKVVITIEDAADGGFTFDVESDPPFPGPASVGQTLSQAQTVALYAANFLIGPAEEDDDGDGGDGEPTPVIVDALGEPWSGQ